MSGLWGSGSGVVPDFLRIGAGPTPDPVGEEEDEEDADGVTGQVRSGPVLGETGSWIHLGSIGHPSGWLDLPGHERIDSGPMDPQASIPGFSFPLSGGLFRVAVRGLGLTPDLHVLDLFSGQGAAALRLARDPGCSVTAVESDPTLCRRAREYARAIGVEGRVSVRQMDPQRLELPAQSFDAVFALGAAPTVLGRGALLERCHFYLRPGGHLLLADIVYLDSPVSATGRQLLSEIRSDEPLEAQANAPGPVVRGLLEQGRYRFETESDYRQLLEAMGYAVEFSFLSPESEWAEYFERMSREYGDRHAHEGDADARTRLCEEAAAYYALGGRASVGYLVLSARCLEYED